MPGVGESMESVFLEGLHLHRAMLDFRPLVQHALQRFLPRPCFIGCVDFLATDVYSIFHNLVFTADANY